MNPIDEKLFGTAVEPLRKVLENYQMSKTRETITLNHEQCAELVEKIMEQAKRESSALLPGNQAAFALGVLKSKATDWLAQLEELRGEILKLK